MSEHEQTVPDGWSRDPDRSRVRYVGPAPMCPTVTLLGSGLWRWVAGPASGREALRSVAIGCAEAATRIAVGETKAGGAARDFERVAVAELRLGIHRLKDSSTRSDDHEV